MPKLGINLEWHAERAPNRPWGAVLGALLISVLAHFLFFECFPEVPIGRPPNLPEQKSYAQILMDKVRVNQPEPERMPPVPQPEEAELAGDLNAGNEQIDNAVVEQKKTEREAFADFVAEEFSVPSLEANTERSGIALRHDILQVEEALFDDNLYAIPPQKVPELLRSPVSSDIVLPEVELSNADRKSFQSGDLDGRLDGLGDVGMLAAVQEDLKATTFGGPLPPDPNKNALGAMLDEQALDVLHFEAVEDELKMGVEFYISKDDPEWRYFKVSIQRKSEEVLPVLPRKVLFVQDCSESIGRSKLKRFKAGLLASLQSLNPNDVFNIMAFREDVDLCFPEYKPVSSSSLAQARLYISSLKSRGKTDVNLSLKNILSLNQKMDDPSLVLLMTDGRPTMGLVDSSEIIESFTRANKGLVSIFSVGGGNRANPYLLDLVSYRNRGEALLVREVEDIPNALVDLSSGIQRPVLARVRYDYTGEEVAELYPANLSHLYLDRPLELFGRIRSDVEQLAFQLVGESGEISHEVLFPVFWDVAQKGAVSLKNAWAKQKLYDLIGKYSKSPGEPSMQPLKRHAQQYGLSVPYLLEPSSPIPF